MKTKIDTRQFRVPPAEAVDLEKWPTLVKPFYKSKAKYGKMLAEHVEQLSSLQRLHYASDRYAEHDFLWRTTRCLPERGRVGIFNLSYYEEVLIVRVHPEILRGERLPPALFDAQTVWKERCRSIVVLENHIFRNGTLIIKFFLHLSAEEQRKRFLERIDDPDKNWKFSAADAEGGAALDEIGAPQ